MTRELPMLPDPDARYGALRCARAGHAQAERHECPFQAEIHDDYSKCTCCAECRRECMDEI